MVYNRSYTLVRKKLAGEQGIKQLAVRENDANDYSPTEESIFFTETSRLIHKAVDQLPPKTKTIYKLWESGLSLQEISEELGLAKQTVKNTLGRSRVEIRDFLLSHGIELPLILICWFL